MHFRFQPVVSFVFTLFFLSFFTATSAISDTLLRRLPVAEINLTSDDKLPESVLESEQRDKVLAIDRDTNSVLTVYSDAELEVTLVEARAVSGVRIFGQAPYRLNVFADGHNRALLRNVDLTESADGWTYFAFDDAILAQSFSFELKQRSGSAAIGLSEIEIVGAAEHIAVDVSDIIETVEPGGYAGQWGRVVLAEDEIALNSDAVSASIPFTLPVIATEIRAAYLIYEMRGETELVGLSRSLNGYAALGGYAYQASVDWTDQVEQVDPMQLASGPNLLSLALGANDNGIELRNVGLIYELADGPRLVSSSELADLLDDNPDTLHSVPGGDSALELPLDKLAAIDSLQLEFGSLPSGVLTVEAREGSGWTQVIDVDLESRSQAGVLDVALYGQTADALRLSFSDVTLPFSAIGLSVSGAEVGPSWGEPRLNVVWPRSGENYGRVAVIRGFVSQAQTEEGSSEISVAGIPVALSGGTFEAVVSREQAGFGDADLSEPWQVRVLLTRPDGSRVAQHVQMLGLAATGVDEQDYIPETTTQLVTVTEDAVLSADGAELELASKSVSEDTELSVTPLLTAELARLDLGMVNVTNGGGNGNGNRAGGYRMLPHMQFNKHINIRLDYDAALIPDGYSEDDINVYFFDEEAGRWVALEGAEVNRTGRWVRARTNHFTDFIAGVVVAPESPQSANFNPSQISGIQAADPSAGINLISPPTATNTGDANLAYPLELPQGRLGLAPSLQVAYSSGAQNGWMGMGWNLSVPEISIDTRWGVPRYDAAFETETYLFNGQQLTPLAHRAALVPREADRVFNTRVEGGFQQIIRHGTNPSNYWWEVIDKMGTRYSYGGSLETGAIDLSAVLLTDTGDVNRWKLTEVRDTNGNFVSYEYDKVASTGLSEGSNLGKNIYVSNIHYTGHNGQEGAYEVIFTRDREVPGFEERRDTTIDGRGGFKMVTADLLRHVEVRLNGEAVRAYEFTYAEGAYYKTLLQSITQYGADGSAFNTHTFDYHDDTRDAAGNYLGFSPNVIWDIPGGDSDGSALQGAETDSSGGFVLIGISFLAPSYERAPLTVGGKFGSNGSDTEHLIAMIDINGDGLADKVYRDGGQISYRENLSASAGGSLTFAASPTVVGNLPSIGEEHSSSGNKTVEAYFAGFNAGLTWSDGTTESSVYFSDVNGDGLVDLVNGATVLFNTIDAFGDPTFTENVTLTEYPIPDSSAAADALDVDLSDVLAALEDAAPLVDEVTVWEAPYDGTIEITSDVALIASTAPERADYETADGVRVAIQHEASELWSQTIDAEDYGTFAANAGPVSVSAGDKIYFRVQSNYDGAFDTVSWTPHVEYVGVDLTTTDANDLPVYIYDHADDFTLFGYGNGSIAAPNEGTIALSGTLIKTAVTTDDVTLEVLVNGAVIDSHVFAAADVGSYTISESVAVVPSIVDDATGDVIQAADLISIRLSNDSRIDASALSWSATDAPRFYYTAWTEAEPVNDENGAPTVVLDLPATTNLLSGSNFTSPATAWVVPEDGAYSLTPEATLVAGAADGVVLLTLKSDGALLAKEELTITAGALVATPIDITLTAGTEIWVEYSDASGFVAQDVIEARLHIELPDPADVTAPIDNLVDETWIAEVHSTNYVARAGEAHRGWLHLGYAGDADQPIAISDADLDVPDQAEMEAIGDDIQTSAESGVVDDTLKNSVDQRVYTFRPNYANAIWVGPEDQVFAAADRAGASRLNLDFPYVPDPMEFVGARGVPQISATSERNITLGAFGVSLSQTDSTSRSILDYLDVNGDQFPDILTQGGKFQYTTMLGNLDSQVMNVPNMEGYTRVSSAEAESIGLGASKPTNMGNVNGYLAANGFGALYTPLVEQNLRGSIGLSGSISDTDSVSEHDLRDMNADGLPDLVKQSGADLLVRYNIGYSFLPAYETFGAAGLNIGDSNNTSLGIGFNSGGNSFSIGGNTANSYSRVIESLVDINGDGLLDSVHTGTNNDLLVRLNSGSGFEDQISWSTGGLGTEFVESNGSSLGAGGSFTVYIPPFIPILFFDIGAGANIGTSTSQTLVRISDQNGDGDPDLLRSTDDGNLRSSYGTDGRTNMLQTVNRPLGATVAMDFSRTGNTYDQPSNRWVMNRVEVFDGFEGDGANYLVSTFAYDDGFFDRQEREFYGFGTVTENHLNYMSAGNETVYRTVRTTYDNDSYYSKGLMLRSETMDADGNLFLATENTYSFVDVETQAVVSDLDVLSNTIFPQLVRSDKEFYEGQSIAGKETYTTFAYDEIGNVVRFFDAANLSTAADDVESLIGYHSDVANYIVGKANSVVVNGAGIEMRRRNAVFETGTGNLIEVASDIGNSDVAVTTMSYDVQGNLSSVLGAENLNGQRYAMNYTYDSTVQTYVTDIIDSFGYTSSAGYDFRFGQVIETVDLNAQEILNTLDEFGRTVTVTGPYQSGDATITFEYNPVLEVPNSPISYPNVDVSWALTQHIDTYRDLADPIETVLLSDGLGRVLQTKMDTTTYDAGTYSDVMTVSGRVGFDFVGRQIEQYYPVEESLGLQGIFNAAYDATAPPVLTDYDILDRPVEITTPDDTSGTGTAVTQMAYGFGADRNGLTQFQTVFTDANGINRETYADVRGLMTSVKEINIAGGQPTIWTSYDYDPLKQIIEVVDDQGNVTTSSYDNLGRQVEIDSPDMGLTSFTFDPASNLIAKQTANLAASGEEISYQYDFSRLMSVTYPQFTDNNITYTYGVPGASDNRANRIVTVQSQAGLEERFYGPLGETVKTILTVASDTQGNSANSPEVYTSEYVFDTWGRMQSMLYPDGELLVNGYDSGGHLISIDGTKAGFDYEYLREVGYDRFGQRTYIHLGNGTETHYSYDNDTRRLEALQTASQQTGRQFQDMTYGYDLVGNILTQANLSENTENSLLGGATSYAYEYDDLYRLVAATGSWSAPNNPESFTLAMGYDSIHNITAKDQSHFVVDREQGKTSYDWTYAYDGPQPHAPTGIGDRTFSYDLNGNQSGWTHNQNGTNRTIVWDEENRIQSIADNGAITEYHYNDAGERIFKIGAQGETVYVNQFYVIRNGQVASKHIFAGAQRLVSKLASQVVEASLSDGGEDTGPQEERDFYFYHPDHLGSSSYVTDIDGEVFQHVEYFPFGETWVEEHSNRQRTPYLFTGKELDEDTQLYYFGARYYDPRTSVWQSPDPILGSYLKGDPNGGVLTPVNLNLYGYAAQKPVRYTDPTGEWFGADDAFTGPVDEILVFGLLYLGATMGIPGAQEGLDGLSNMIGNALGSGIDSPAGLSSLPQSEAALNVPSRTMGLTGDYTARENIVFRASFRTMRQSAVAAGVVSAVAAQNQKIILIPEGVIPEIAAVDAQGILTHGSTLTWDPANARARRQTAIGSLGAAGLGRSWEEYPFAATQGRSSAPTTTGNVRLWEQWVQGGLIRGACAVQACKPGDTIHVYIVPSNVYQGE